MTPPITHQTTDIKSLQRIVLASHNAHKLQELRDALRAWHLNAVTIELAPSVPDVEETGDTFTANALLKARAFTLATHLTSLADDSGLCVDALQGAPGVYSARFSGVTGEGATAANNATLLQRLHGLPPSQRRAHFRCVLALTFPCPPPSLAAIPPEQGVTWAADLDGRSGYALFEGHTSGYILDQPRGSSGFGYDPLFLSDDLGVTFAEATPDQKHAVSHRGQAVAKLVRWLGHVFNPTQPA
jgi:XTP/dITP diphosphohydrolase